ncbi:MAG: hypothetical protein IT182_16435 [Acidobacteria bacterium]|nr:hypothetical protein [Acidobacteriota bacterium]
MTERSLQVTYRKGRPFAAYLHLPHTTGDRCVRTVATPDGLLLVDYNSAGQPLGLEITAPSAVSLARVNDLLTSLGEPPMADHEFKPVQAA